MDLKKPVDPVIGIIIVCLMTAVAIIYGYGMLNYDNNCNIPMLPNQGFIKPIECYGYNLCVQQGDMCAHMYGNSTDIRNLAEENNCQYDPTHNNYSVNFTKPDGSTIWC